MKLSVEVVILVLLSLIHTINSLESNEPVVNTKLGKIKGSLMKTRLGKTIYTFRGIYYAEPPTGKNRFKPPIPIKPWTKIFDATKEGPACTQEKGINLSENCLALNIYTKQINGSKRSPVIVYIHPGLYMAGSGQSFLYGPQYLLDHDIVLVTINHRLASLGFLNTGDEYSPGNMALKDQVLALKFVRDHITPFGGDPNSVTLAGQSSGSRSIILHLVSRMSKGLFHRAIAMSGSMTTPIPPQREQLETVKKAAFLLNCTTESTEKMVQCLRERPAQELGDIIPLFKEWYDNPSLNWYPSVESNTLQGERFLTDEPQKLMQSGKIFGVPLIIGVTKDEYSFKVADAIENARNGNDSYFQDLASNWHERAPLCFQYERNSERSKFISRKLYEFYFGNKTISVETSDILRRLFANAIVHWPVHRAATLLSKHMAEPVYFYEFTYPGPYSRFAWSNTKKPSSGVAHGDDLQYIFNIENEIYHPSTGFPLYKETDPQNVMVKRLTGIWAHFAKTGEPLPNDSEIYGNVTWERLTANQKSYLDIGKNLSLKSDFLGETMRFWDSLFPEKYLAN